MTEPTKPRTWHTRVVFGPPGQRCMLAGYLPDGWEPGTPVVVSTVPPDGLWPGPDGTWFASAATAAKLNYAATDDMGDDRQWVSPESFDPNQVVLCRPVPAPEPATVRVPWWDAVGRKMDEDTVITKLVAEKRLNDPDMAVQVWNDDGTWIDPYEDEDDDGMVTVLRDADPTPTDPPSEQGDAVVGRCMTEGCPGHWTGTEECTYSPAPSVVPADSPDTQRDGWDLDEDGYPQFYEKGKPDETIRLSYDAACALVALVRRDRPTAEQAAVIDAAHLAHQREWSTATFGPGKRTNGVLDHIRKELAEIEDDPTDVTEWVDVIILAFDGAWRAGWEPQEIIDAIVAKQARNEARTWPDWRTMSEDQAIEHDRSADAVDACRTTEGTGE